MHLAEKGIRRRKTNARKDAREPFSQQCDEDILSPFIAPFLGGQLNNWHSPILQWPICIWGFRHCQSMEPAVRFRLWHTFRKDVYHR